MKVAMNHQICSGYAILRARRKTLLVLTWGIVDKEVIEGLKLQRKSKVCLYNDTLAGIG